MKLLSLDTSTEPCSCALCIEGVYVQKVNVLLKTHTKIILSMIQTLINENNIKIKDINCLAFGRGPGSFTGLRVASSIIQGLSFGWSKPILSISSLQTLAQTAYRLYQVKKVYAILDARMHELYFGEYILSDSKIMQLAGKEQLITPEKLAERNLTDGFCVGTGVTLLSSALNRLDNPILYPQAQDLAYLALYEYKEGNTCTTKEALPVYLRNNVVH